MKNFKLAVAITMMVLTGLHAQVNTNNDFQISQDAVKVYDFETTTTGFQYELQFEDAYSLKLTNKRYNIKLFFEEAQSETVQKTVSRILDEDITASGFKTMVWKETGQDGKPVYSIELKNGKLQIEVRRKNANKAVYKQLTTLGQEVIKAINR